MGNLGRLERVELRDIWKREDTAFTPWLAKPENIQLLGEAIGLELEVEAREKDVGRFYADILCREVGSGDLVLIENQLERTDHGHLGQVITYAAGLHTVTIIWIAAEFTEEHRAAVDWLNEISDENFNFFGLEIELWRIGDSQAAPKFNIVAKPNQWSKTVSARLRDGELTDTRKTQLAYWTAFSEYLSDRAKRIRATKPQPQTWMSFSVGRTGFRLDAIASSWDSEQGSFDSGEIRAELVIYHEHAKEYFALLEAQRDEIDAELNAQGETHWQTRDDARACKIYYRRAADITDEANWPDQHEWLFTRLELLHATLANRIKDLEPEDEA